MTDRQKEATISTLPQLDQFDFHQRVSDMTGTTLVMFTSPDCGSCRHARRQLLDVRRQKPGWQVYEVDAQRDPGLAREFEVFHLPTIFLFQDGQFHCLLEAEARPASIVSSTENALLQPAGETP